MNPVSPLDCAVLPGPYHCSVVPSLAGRDCPPTARASLWVFTLTRTSVAKAGDARNRSTSGAMIRVMR